MELLGFARRASVGCIGLVGLCGCAASGESRPAPSTSASKVTNDAGAHATATASLAPPTDVTLPPERPVPPLALGSKVAHVRGRTDPSASLGDPPQPACVIASNATSTGNADATTLALARACAPTMKPVGAAHTVSMSERDPGIVIPLVATRGCYRVFAASPAGVDGFVVVIVDSRGAIAAEGRATGRSIAVPAEGPLCFDGDDAAKVVTSAGRGAGNGSVLIVRE